jgi:3'-phosphoadenosine 5'-phosphosulfate (PAPS) 3'-phosphatase
MWIAPMMEELRELATPYRADLDIALVAATRASETILQFYDARSAETYVKGDGSPVTDADLATDKVIREVIATSFPGDAFLTEEGASDESRLRNSRCWIVDPIDGTAQYVARTGLFDVMIALVVDGVPTVAVTVQPVAGRIQAAVAGYGAWESMNGETTRFVIAPSPTPPRVVSSKWYGGREVERGAAVRRIGSRLGDPEPEILEVGYQSRAFSPDMRRFDVFVGLPQVDFGSIAQEWDLACIDLITHEAGGVLTDCWGRRHRYNKRSSGIAGGILASANPALHRRVLAAVEPELPTHRPALDPWDDGQQ